RSAYGAAGGARSGDDGDLGRREGRTGGGPTGLPVGLLRSDIDHAGRQAGAASSAGSNRAVLDRAVRTLSALGAGAGPVHRLVSLLYQKASTPSPRSGHARP